MESIKKLIAIFICLSVFIISMSPVMAASIYKKTSMGVVINGKLVRFERQPVLKNGRMLVPARTACNMMGAVVSWYEKQGRFEIIKGGTALDMYIGDDDVRIGDSNVRMEVEPFLQSGTVMVPLRFAAEMLGLKVSMDTRNNNVVIGSGQAETVTSRGDDRKTFKVVIDPGHGGYETGAITSGVYEKNLNLDIAKRLNSLLMAEDIKTYMTRAGDSYVSLYERSGLANSVDADLLISIHNNAQTQKWISGSMSLYYPGGGNSKGNLSAQKFASLVQGELTSELGAEDLGIIQRPHLAVLRTANMPAVLAEIGYMTNQTEFKKLLSSDYKQKVAEALNNAIIAALNKI